MRSERGVRGTLIALLLVLPLGCDRERGGDGWSAAVDTAGDVIRVVNTPPVTGAAPTLVGVEELRIGTVEGDGATSFGLIRSIAVLQDGRVAVADGQAEEVRLFDREGRHVRTMGGAGAGPGELQGLQGVYVDHQGLLRVPESRNARLSIFDPDSGFVDSYPLQLYTTRGMGPWMAAVDSVGRTFVASSGPFGVGRYWNMLRIYDATMTQLDSVPYHDYTDEIMRDYPGVWRIPLGNRGFATVMVPFYAQEQQALSPTGEFWSSAGGQRELSIARWTPPGDTALVFQSGRRPSPLTAAERDSAIADISTRLGEQIPNLPELDASRIPSIKPPLFGLSLDDRGRVWVRITQPGISTTTYDVFNGDGTHAETVDLPFGIDGWIPPLVRGDTLWAVVTDETEVQYVVKAQLRPPNDS